MDKLFSRSGGVVFASTIGTAIGITSTIVAILGLVLVPIADEFNLPRSSISLVFFILAICSALIYPVIGHLADKYGPRIVIIVGHLLFVASLFAVSLARNIGEFYTAFVFIGLSGSVLGPILFTKIIAGWFDRYRGFFLGIISGVGYGIGSTLMPIFAVFVLSGHTWRTTYQAIAILVLVIGFPAIFLLLRNPPDPLPEKTYMRLKGVAEIPGLTLGGALKTRAFWMVMLAIAISSGCMLAVFTHTVPILMDRGLPVIEATSVLSIFALFTVFGQIGTGFLLDHFRRPNLIAPFFFIPVIGLPLLMSASSTPLLLLSGALMGLGMGTEFGLLPFCLSRYFGLKAYGKISGLVYGIIALTNGFFPVLMDVGFDLRGSYVSAINIVVGVMVIGTLLIALLPDFKTVSRLYLDPAKQSQSAG
ncbi:MAG: MFS transporter [Robiginitomaculum sp.]|nr:MAG: MFS transporter [Robiginitomaculum sp.]